MVRKIALRDDLVRVLLLTAAKDLTDLPLLANVVLVALGLVPQRLVRWIKSGTPLAFTF